VNGSDVDSRRVRELDRSVLVTRLELVLGCVEVMSMAGRAVVSLSTGLEDPEKVTVAFLVAVGAAESGRPTLMFLTKEAVRLAIEGIAVGVACSGCPPLVELVNRYQAADGRYYVCPVCFEAKQLDRQRLITGAEVQGTVPMWEWIGDEGATTFSY
jgi:predicted peroxiredoxin